MVNARFTLEDVRSRTYKGRDAWWTVVLVDPLAGRLVRFTANRTSLSPNSLSSGALVLGLGAAWCFWEAGTRWLVLGAVLYHLSFVLDCMDGKIARLKGTGTVFGSWLDYVFDRVRVLICALALTGGQYEATGRPEYLALGVAIVFLDMLRYLDALKVAAARREMRSRLRAARGAVGEDRFVEQMLPVHPDEVPDEVVPQAIDLQQEFRAQFSWYLRVRDWLARRRIRPHLVSGIEFQMAVFIIGPLCQAIIPVTAVAGLLMLVFEVAIIYKLWLSTRDFARAMAEAEGERVAA
ncbi:CDP-alcohol phosphatidyltransferase family protein [Actinomadura sp. DC4]|uniref:CDP-alcohol phosphatidyltransferase family protein n=1 Tax=Actinomadura sp. DC4 TaxID=3055069 RepID=UPI0025B0275F|nr:CDP-alcohol phosphatidyltransferase family protein [Actinomadura sp. DC4]MDN3352470.1 CDP-alcohol phosphatidyltransferase family protein [Actinomadura sp. DC4]